MRLKRVPYDEGDAPAFCAGPPCRAGEGEDRVLRRSQVGDLGLVTSRAQPGLRQQHDVDVVLNEGGYVGPPHGSANGSCIEEADKECVFGWGRTKGNVKQLSVRGTQRSAERGGWEVVTVTGWRGRWYGSGVLTGGWRAGRIGWKLFMKTDDHFDLPPFILPSSSRSAWLSGHVSRNAVIDVRSAGGRGRGRCGSSFQRQKVMSSVAGDRGGTGGKLRFFSLCCVAHGCCDARLHWTRCHWTQAQHDRLAASSVKQRVESGLAETKQDQVSSLPVEVTQKTGTTITATSRETMLSRQLIKPGD